MPPPPSTATRSPGRRCWPARRRSTRRATGCPTRRSTTFRSHLIGIKGPLTTPVGGGIRSLNVALRQILDLYVCLRPVRWFTGVPSPVLHPELVDMVIFRENTEDVYAGYEVQAGTPEAEKLTDVPARRDGLAHPGRLGHRHQADLGDGIQAPHPRRHRVRARPQAPLRDAGAQGQHPEVHRGRVPRVGLRARARGVRRRRRRAGTTAAASPATSCSSRTPSPTSRCSRC